MKTRSDFLTTPAQHTRTQRSSLSAIDQACAVQFFDRPRHAVDQLLWVFLVLSLACIAWLAGVL